MLLDEKTVYEHLKILGVSPHLKGYHYIKEAILYTSRVPVTKFKMTNAYSAVSSKMHCTNSQAERCIRTCIEYVFWHTDPCILEKYFGNTVSYTSGKVTNQQFIWNIIEYANYHSDSISTNTKNLDK